MNNTEKRLIADALRNAMKDAEIEAKNYAENVGDKIDYAFAFGFLCSKLKYLAWAIEDDSETSLRK